MLFEQSKKIYKSGYQPDIIVGIARGGMVSANILADLLDISKVAIIRIEFYADIAKPNMYPVLNQSLNVAVNGKKVLIVDDVSDSGQSLKIAKQHLIEKGANEIKIATLYAKVATQTMPDYVEKFTPHWLVFPWEIKETIQNILKKQETRENNKSNINNEFAKLVKAGLPIQFLEQILKTLQEHHL
jgi:hypoxanthine phosphoribosyltransferase